MNAHRRAVEHGGQQVGPDVVWWTGVDPLPPVAIWLQDRQYGGDPVVVPSCLNSGSSELVGQVDGCG